MKHARQDYNAIQAPNELIPENEPVFLLRGQDPLAPETLRFWAKKLKHMGGDKKMAKLVKRWSKVMEEYQRNRDLHLPDMPEGKAAFYDGDFVTDTTNETYR